MPDLPSGAVTFLFTDIEGSTRMWEQSPATMEIALARHDALLREAIETNAGSVFKTVGDAFCAAFGSASAAVAAALKAQRALLAERWPEPVALTVRMALHTGNAEARGGDYFGQPLNHVARLLAIGHGKQVLLSEATMSATGTALPIGASLLDRGTHRLKDLHKPEKVFQLCHPDLPAQFPPLRSLSTHPNNLPQQLTSFIGREQEMAAVKERLGKTRLLTLTGSGGCGKTRLALQVATDLLEAYPDGVWLAELAALADPGLVPQTVATVFGLKEERGKGLTQTLVEYLASKRLLLVLDNAEHLLAACARLAEAVLQQCPQVVVLASSREGLGMAGEVAFRVPSLSLPDPGRDVTPEGLASYESVHLFVDRARAVRPSFQVDASNAAALASVCSRLDGIPLALELAAARVRSLSVEEVNQRLDQRFRLLTGGSRTALPRQQTLRSLIDWSYDLLTDAERALFRRLAVFAGGWTLEAAEQVCAGEDIDEAVVLDLLTSLVDKSLAVADERNGATRYRMLETVRQYARDRLLESGEGAAWRDRHLSCFLSVAEAAEPQLTGAAQQALLDRLETEHDNLRSALAWSAAEGADAASGLRLAGAVWWFWFVRGYLGEGRQWLSGLLAAAPGEPAARAKALAGAGGLARQQGDYEAARSLYEECLALQREQGDRRGVAAALSNLGLVAFHRGDYSAAHAFLDEGLAMQRDLGDRQGIAMSLNSMGMVTADQADYRAAQALYEESLAIRRELGDRQGIATSLNNLGIVAAHQGDYATARALYEEGLVMRRELGDRRGVALTLNNLGMVAYQNGDAASARTVFEESLKVFRELGDRRGIALSLTNLGGVAAVQGDYPSARALHEESRAVHRESGDRQGVATSLSNLGIVAVEQGDYRSALALLAEGVSIQRDLGDRLSLAESLLALARVAFALSGPRRAAIIWGGAERLREEINAPLAPGDRPGYERRVAAARAALGDDAAFDLAWQEGRAMTADEVVACALEERDA